MAAAAPVPAPAWHDVADPDGTHHQLCLQALDSTCAPACVAMVVRKIKSTACEEPAARRKLDALMANVHSGGQKNWNDDGANPHIVASALSGFQVNSARTLKNLAGTLLKDALKGRCFKAKPGIGFVYWKQGGGHAIVVLGPDNASQNLLVLDPLYNGVVRVPIGDLPRYDPPYNAQGFQGIGYFGRFLVTTS